MKKINILFLGGAKRVSIANAFINAGKELNQHVTIFTYDLSKNVPISTVSIVIEGKKWTDHDVIDHLMQEIKKNKINIILPFIDTSIPILSKLRKKLDLFFPLSHDTLLANLYNKKKAHIIFTKLQNINVPKLKSTAPLICKPIYGYASKNICICQNEHDLKQFKRNNKCSDFIFQEFINGDEYSIDAYINKKNYINCIVPRKRNVVLGGEITEGITVNDPDIIETSKYIITQLKLIGPITIQMIRSKLDNKLYIIEINPRFGGGAPLSIKAGANIPLYLLKDYLNIKNNQYYNYKNDIGMKRFFKEYFYHHE